jgi:hypothetical protein
LLKWICDVAELIRVHPLDWGLVLRRARQLGCERILLLGLFLARQVLGTTLPLEILSRMSDQPVVGELASLVLSQLFAEPPAPVAIWKYCLLYLRAHERLRDRIRYGLALLLNLGEEDWKSFPGVPPVLHHFLRPFRLAEKYGKTLIRRLWR